MIALEYIIAQHQDANTSLAIKSHKNRQQNPAIRIRRSGTNIIWDLLGLNNGTIENVQGTPRASRVDFYIGLEDLIEQRNLFFVSTGVSLGLTDGLRNPVGTERAGGKAIRWNGPLGRLEIENVEFKIPPYNLRVNVNAQLTLNLDRESSTYPITSNGGVNTIRELHFGIEHNFISRQDNRLQNPKISITLSENQYATILYFIDQVIDFFI